MGTIAHLKYKLELSHSTPQTRNVPGFRHIQLLRDAKSISDKSLLTKDVYFLKDLKSPSEFSKEQEIDLLHAHHGNLGVKLIPFIEEANIPLVCGFRGKDATEVTHLQQIQYQQLFKMGAGFFPVCKFLADKISQLGCPPEKIKVLYGGIDVDRFVYRPPSQKEKINILSVGRFVEKKGHDILLRAFAKVRGRHKNISLTIIGRGKMKSELEKLATQLKLGNSVKLLDWISYEMLPVYMSQADIFCLACLTSKGGNSEGIPNTLKEAMAIGLPVISTQHAGIPELVTNFRDGLLVRENDINELAFALEFLLDHPEFWNIFSQLGRKKIEDKFNLQKQLILQSIFYHQILREVGTID